MPRELNPNHPVTAELREQYHKLLAIVMWRFGLDTLVVTSDEIERFIADHPNGVNVAFEPKGHNLTVRIVDDAEGQRLARKEGGLPSEPDETAPLVHLVADTSTSQGDGEPDAEKIVERRHLECVSGFYVGALFVLMVFGLATLLRYQ